MSDSNAQSRIHANLSQKSLQSITFQTKNTNTLQDILQTLKSQCLQFQSFQDLQKHCFQLKLDPTLLTQAINQFMQELLQSLSCMVFNVTCLKGGQDVALYEERLRLLEEKILKDPETFKETCRIYYNIQNLTEMNIKQVDKKKTGLKAKKLANTLKLKKTTKNLKAEKKKEKKTKKTMKKNTLTDKLLLRLLPNSTETHQIMMKLDNFPRLELKVSPANSLRIITDYLDKKWLTTCSTYYSLEYYPDESKWLKNVSIQTNKSKKLTNLSENYMINDLFSAYNCPENKVMYLFYELRENVKVNREYVECGNVKKIKKEVNFLEKPSNFSSTQNNSKETSEENYIFAENLLKNMDLLKNEVTETKNPILSCTNFININEISSKNLENSMFSINNDLKKSINFSNFSEKKEDCHNFSKKAILKQEDIIKKVEEDRKDVTHLKKIKHLVDFVGKSYENLQKK